jgi:autotransporter-associated beta strand protein
MNKPKSFVQMMLVLTALVGAAGFATGAPATDSWTGSSGANWSSPGNWTGGNAPPQPGDSLIFGNVGGTLNNDLTAGSAIDGITFSGPGAFTLNGNTILLSDTNNANDIGVLNESGLAQTLGLNVGLDWGFYEFYSISGSVGLNGTLTLNPGAVAYFGPGVTSTSLTTDSSGLIAGLGGAGLNWNGTAPTGFATISGGSLGAYTTSPGNVLASGATIPSNPANNIELSATGAAGSYTLAGGSGSTFVSTILVDQTGGANNSDFTTTVTDAGTLVLGTNNAGSGPYIGGICVPNSQGTNHATFSLSGGNLTAGPMSGTATPGTIVFAVNGANPNNQASVSSTIANNGSGGAVTVIKTGTGTMNFATTTTSSYTGGVYVDQGQLQWGQVQQIGTGAVYVASNASAYYIGTGTMNNSFYLSPGYGASDATISQGGALIFAGATTTLTGTINLLGPAASTAPGDRIAGNGTSATYTITGQITGTGTLDFAGAHSYTVILNNPNTSGPNANNWQGGTIVDAPVGHAVNVDLKMGANGQMPTGVNAGSLTLISAQAGIYARFDLNATAQTIGGLNGSSGSVSNQVGNFAASGSAVLTLGANDHSGNFTGETVDSSTAPLSLVKIGAGTQTFNGTSQGVGNGTFGYHGSTTISNGTLALTGSALITNTPVITVAAGATLDAGSVNGGGINVGLTPVAQTLNSVGTVVGNTVVNGTVMAFDSIGTFSNNGNLTLNGGGTFVWDINNATGAAGSDPGWSKLNVSGQLVINSSSGSPFNINITSLTAGDLPGNAANFNPNANGTWVIATSSGGIAGFTGTAQFNIITSNFGNAPSSASQWNVTSDGFNLYLNYTALNLITTPLVSVTNNAGTSASFTVASTTGTQPITFAWYQGLNQLVNGGTTASGASVAITSGGGGTSSTLTIGGSGVQDADAGGFTVNVSDNAGHNGSSSATLTVIDAPSNVNVPPPAQSITPVSAGAVNTLVVSASGGINGVTPNFTYQWFLNGNAISGATSSTLNIDVNGAATGNYTVVVSNSAGNVTSSTTTIGPVSVVPDQIVFEPFNYVAQSSTQSAGNPWTATAAGQTNVAGLSQVYPYIYNQATGVGLLWQQEGTVGQEWTLQQDMRIEPGYTQNYSNYTDFDGAANAPFGDIYPWPGLAGNDPNEMACNSGNTDVVLPLGTGGSISNGTIYFSVIMHVDQGAAITQVDQQYFCGFGTGAANSTAFNASIYINVPGDDTYTPGVFKVAAGAGALAPGVNGNWSSKAYHRGEIVFAVVRLTMGPGANDDTCDLWLDPNPSTFYAAEGNLPPPDVSAAGGGSADVGNVDSFYFKNSNAPFSRRYTDLRIGRTWASVTPPSAPTLSLADQTVGLGQTVVVFASQNAGNPAVAYQWQFNGGTPLSDNSHYSGTGTATLVISNLTIADIGVYTVTGVNSDPAPSGQVQFGATYTGSASAALRIAPIPSIAASGSSVIVSWPTNFTGWTLQHTSSLTPSSWSTASLPSPVIVGTNYTVTVGAPGGQQFFRLTK